MESIIPSILQELLRKSVPPCEGLLAEMEKMAKIHYIPIVYPEVANFLSMLVEISGARRILEIGTAIGYSTLWMAKVLPADGLITTIEIDEERAKVARQNFVASGFEHKIHSIIGDAREVLSYMHTSFDFVFLDAAKGQYSSFLPDCLRLLRKGGILVADNVFFGGLVFEEGEPGRKKRTIVKNLQSFLVDLFSYSYLKSCILPLGDGITVSIKKRVEDTDDENQD